MKLCVGNEEFQKRSGENFYNSMKDQKLIELFKEVRQEMLKRYGTKMCTELHANCGDCKMRIMLAYINDEVDLLEWWIERDNKFKKIRNHKKQ